MRRLAFTGVLMGCALGLVAQAPTQPPAQISDEDLKELLDLLNTPVSVASKRTVSARETPGIVTVLTREEILRSGARDLVDVLRSVPGFEFGLDVLGVTGISVRGLWAYEGKVLLLWDGLEINETLFGNIPLGHHFPVEQIERIEIIRGPGSSLYGGYAEVAVIQVTTIRPKGAGFSLAHGQGNGGPLRSEGLLVAGGNIGGATWDVGAYGGEGQRSRGDYVDPTGVVTPLGGNSRIRPGLFNFGLAGAGLQFRVLADQYLLDSADYFGPALERPVPVRFSSLHADLKGTFKPAQGWTLQPYVNWKTQKPFWSSDPLGVALQLTIADRTRAGLNATFAPSAAWEFAGGAEQIRDSAQLRPPTNTPPVFLNGSDRVDYDTSAFFLQAQYSGPLNVTVGARYESSSATRSSFVPRLAITKAWENWHAKLLLAKAFRSPAILNLNLQLDPSQPLNPEETTSSELEIGRRVGSGLLTLSVFNIQIDKPIIFTVTDTAVGYFNQESTGSRGWEIEYRARWGEGGLNASWSHHDARNRVDALAVPGQDSAFLGAPQDKVVVGGSWHRRSWSLNPSAVWLGPRWAYDYVPAIGGVDLTRVSSDLLLQVNATWDLGAWHLSLGVQDLLDRAPSFIQAYNGGHPPLPGPGREVLLRVRYGF